MRKITFITSFFIIAIFSILCFSAPKKMAEYNSVYDLCDTINKYRTEISQLQNTITEKKSELKHLEEEYKNLGLLNQDGEEQQETEEDEARGDSSVTPPAQEDPKDKIENPKDENTGKRNIEEINDEIKRNEDEQSVKKFEQEEQEKNRRTKNKEIDKVMDKFNIKKS